MRYNSLKTHVHLHSRQQINILKRIHKDHQENPLFYYKNHQEDIRTVEQKVGQIAIVDKMILQLNTFKENIHDKQSIQKAGKNDRNSHHKILTQLPYNIIKPIHRADKGKQLKSQEMMKHPKKLNRQKQNKASTKKQMNQSNHLQSDKLTKTRPSYTPKSRSKQKVTITRMGKKSQQHIYQYGKQIINHVDNQHNDCEMIELKPYGYFSKEVQSFLTDQIGKKSYNSLYKEKETNSNKKSIGKIVKNNEKNMTLPTHPKEQQKSNIMQVKQPSFSKTYHHLFEESQKKDAREQIKSIKIIKQKNKIKKLNIKLQTEMLQEYLLTEEDSNNQPQTSIRTEEYGKYCQQSKRTDVPQNIQEKDKISLKNDYQPVSNAKREPFDVYEMRDRNNLKQKVNLLNNQIQKIELKSKLLSKEYKNETTHIRIQLNKDTTYHDYKSNMNPIASNKKEQRKLNTTSKQRNISNFQPQQTNTKKEFIKPSEFMPSTSNSSNFSSNVKEFQSSKEEPRLKRTYNYSTQPQIKNDNTNQTKIIREESIGRSRRFTYEKQIQNIVQEQITTREEQSDKQDMNTQVIMEEEQLQVSNIEERECKKYNSISLIQVKQASVIKKQTQRSQKIQKSAQFIRSSTYKEEKSKDKAKETTQSETVMNITRNSQQKMPCPQGKKDLNDELIHLFNFMDHHHRGLLTDTNCNINLLTEELKLLFSSIIIQIKSKKKFYNINKFIQESNEVIQIKNELYSSNTARKNMAFQILKENIQILKRKFPLQFVKCTFTNSTYEQSNVGSKRNSVSNNHSIVIQQIKGGQALESQSQCSFLIKDRESFMDEQLYSARISDTKDKYLAKSILNQYRMNSQQPEIYLQGKYGLNTLQKKGSQSNYDCSHSPSSKELKRS